MTRTIGAKSGEPFQDAEHELEEADLGESLVGGGRRLDRRRRPRLRSPIGSAADLRHQPRELASARPEQRRQRARIDVPEQGPERFDERPVRQPARPERQAAAD